MDEKPRSRTLKPTLAEGSCASRSGGGCTCRENPTKRSSHDLKQNWACQTLINLRPPCSEVCVHRSRSAVTVTPSMSSSNGIVRNRDSPSIELLCCATECSSNPAIWLRAQSTYGWLRFGDWHTRPPMLVYLARSWLLVYVALRVPRSWVSGLEIGYPRVRRALCGDLPMLKRSKASETARLLPSCSAVVFDDGNWPNSLSTTFR